MLSSSDRLSDRVSALEKSTTRIDQKLDDLNARLPPADHQQNHTPYCPRFHSQSVPMGRWTL